MKLFTKKDKRTMLEKAIDKLEGMLIECEDPKEYVEITEKLDKLYSMKQKAEANKQSISLDTLVVVLGNLFGILLILNYEHMGVITSKAMSLVIKGRV